MTTQGSPADDVACDEHLAAIGVREHLGAARFVAGFTENLRCEVLLRGLRCAGGGRLPLVLSCWDRRAQSTEVRRRPEGRSLGCRLARDRPCARATRAAISPTIQPGSCPTGAMRMAIVVRGRLASSRSRGAMKTLLEPMAPAVGIERAVSAARLVATTRPPALKKVISRNSGKSFEMFLSTCVCCQGSILVPRSTRPTERSTRLLCSMYWKISSET